MTIEGMRCFGERAYRLSSPAEERGVLAEAGRPITLLFRPANLNLAMAERLL